jgi:hypothetical protein
MKRPSLLILLTLLGFLLLSCTLVRVPPTATRVETLHAVATQPATVTLTGTATSTLRPTHTLTPVPPTSTPTSAPPTPTPALSPTSTPLSLPSHAPPAEGYIVEEERLIGSYVVRLWKNAAEDSFIFDKIGTISAGGRRLAQVEWVFELGDETGADFTGEGHPDVVFRVYTGGAHCCSSTIVYDLGDTLTKVMETPLSNCSGSLLDLDGDGIYEYETCDDLFAYTFCCYAGSPAVRVVLRYEPGRGYVPASPHFADLYGGDIFAHSEMAEGAQSGEMCEWDGTTKCAVLPLVLDYLYAGQPDKAWAEFNRLYDGDDALLFWAEVVQAVTRSPLYAPGDSPIVVEALPAHYMLQLLTSCDGDGVPVGLLLEGQSGCDPAVLRRSVYWLADLLRDIPLLSEEESLKLEPEGCTTNCRLDVVRTLDDAREGSIRLDTTTGFPGEVYRVNSQESDRWRLRGDLTWERVSR